MHPSNSATIQLCEEGRSRSAMPPSAASSAAASYEARKFGVRSALPSTTAQRKCPDLVFVPPRFEVYRAVSKEIHAIFADYTPLIEPLSLDEAYLDVTDNLRAIPTAAATAAEIRARIFEKTGLTASAGISTTSSWQSWPRTIASPMASSSYRRARAQRSWKRCRWGSFMGWVRSRPRR